jgi:hypothetical protein
VIEEAFDEEFCIVCGTIAPEIIPISGDRAWIMTRHIELICPDCKDKSL